MTQPARVLLLILLTAAFLAAGAVALWLTYLVFSSFFASLTAGLIAAGVLLLGGGFFTVRGLRAA